MKIELRDVVNNMDSYIKEYDLWQNMLKRCFSEKYQTRQTTYKGCNVSDNFLHYSFFYDWCQTQTGFGNIDENGRYWQLDKDLLLVGNKTYSETTCVFVPQEINTFFVDSGAIRGDYPVGVYFNKRDGKFMARCAVNGKRQYLGLFNTPEEAFTVYKPFKEALCKQLALKWESEIDPRLFNTMMNWCVKMSNEIEVGDKVAFTNIKYLKLPTKTKHNIPLCLFGLHVEGKGVDKGTSFKVKCVSNNGIVVEVDEFPNGMYFDKIWLEFAGTSIEALVSNSDVVNNMASYVEEHEPF